MIIQKQPCLFPQVKEQLYPAVPLPVFRCLIISNRPPASPAPEIKGHPEEVTAVAQIRSHGPRPIHCQLLVEVSGARIIRMPLNHQRIHGPAFYGPAEAIEQQVIRALEILLGGGEKYIR